MNGAGTAKERVAVIDDEEVMRVNCKRILERAGYEVEVYQDGITGLEGIVKFQPDLAIVDLKMPGMSGFDVIKRLRDDYPDIVIVVITGYATVESAVESIRAGAYDFLPKPFIPDELRVVVRRALERRHLAVEAARLKREREAMERRVATFLSEELQSPLSAVENHLRVLLHLMGSTASREQLEWIQGSLARVKELFAIIREWLRLSRVECELASSKRVPVRVEGIISELVDSYKPRAEERGLRLSLDGHKDLPPAAVNAEALLKMAFSNLLDNAIKLSRREGSLSVSLAVEGESVKVTVSGTGIGVPEGSKEGVFEGFFNVRDDSAVTTSGAGLGLSICKKIVEELGGRIEVDSRPGEGSRFTVSLPAYGRGAQGAEDQSDEVGQEGADNR